MTRRALHALAAGLLAAAVAACGPALGQAGEEALVVAAAADLRPAFDRIAADFEADTGAEVTVMYGSSGQLAQQLAEGAPADLFASANVAYAETVLEAGRGDAGSLKTYAVGRLAIWARADTWGGWADLTELAADTDVERLAIANPGHAPYGAAAEEALLSAGVHDAVADRLVLGEHIADTQRLAATGNADAALTALSLALAAEEDGAWELVPAEQHTPIEQALVVVATEPERVALAERFAAHLDGPAGREVLRAAGFQPPGEDPPEAWER